MFECGAFSYTVNADDSATIVDYFSTADTLEIPAKLDSKAVAAIGDNAFYYSDITEIVIPNSVTSIGSFAFAYCNNLRQYRTNEVVL